MALRRRFREACGICKEYLQKGRQAYVEGRLRTREYEFKNDGGKRQRTEIVAQGSILRLATGRKG